MILDVAQGRKYFPVVSEAIGVIEVTAATAKIVQIVWNLSQKPTPVMTSMEAREANQAMDRLVTGVQRLAFLIIFSLGMILVSFLL